MVKISVLIPVYNVSQFLEESIGSLLNQSFEDIELICVNDGSKDNSLEILNDFAKKDSRVKVIDKPNGGCGSARNRALEEATGEFFYFFDPDDYILPNAFEELIKNIESNGSDLVLFKIATFMDGEPINYDNPLFSFDKIFTDVDFNHFTFNYKDVLRHVLNSGFAPWSKLYRKSFLDKYDDFKFDLGVAFDDVPFHVKSMLRAEKISFAPDYYYHYRDANPNSVNNTASNGIDIMKIVDLVEEFIRNEGYFEELREEFYYFKLNQIIRYMISSHNEDYFQLAKKNLLEFKHDDIKHLPSYHLEKYYLIINSDSYEEYEIRDEIHEMNIAMKKYRKENKRFKYNIKRFNRKNKKIMGTKSWKYTKPLRLFNKNF